MKFATLTVSLYLGIASALYHSWDVVSLVPSPYRTLLSLMPEFDWDALSSNPSYFIGVMTQLNPSDIPFTRHPGTTEILSEVTVTDTVVATSTGAKSSNGATGPRGDFAIFGFGAAALAGALFSLV